jgi:hypothetical protein
MIAKRRAWQAIVTLMWERDMKLMDALRKVQGNVLWWTNELEIKRNEAPRGKGPQKGGQSRPQPQWGKGKGSYQSQPRRAQPTHIKTDGHQAPRGKNKGKGKTSRNDSGRNPKRSLPGNTDGFRIPQEEWGDPPKAKGMVQQVPLRESMHRPVWQGPHVPSMQKGPPSALRALELLTT